MQTHFKKCEIPESRQATGFATHFGVVLERVEQGPGIVGDYRVTTTSKKTEELETLLGYSLLDKLVEFKNDGTSLTFKSFYVEFEQTVDYWNSRSKSGHVKAIDAGCLLILASGNDSYVFDDSCFEEFLKGTIREQHTKSRSNGNQPTCFTRGKIVPLKWARKTAKTLYPTYATH